MFCFDNSIQFPGVSFIFIFMTLDYLCIFIIFVTGLYRSLPYLHDIYIYQGSSLRFIFYEFNVRKIRKYHSSFLVCQLVVDRIVEKTITVALNNNKIMYLYDALLGLLR